MSNFSDAFNDTESFLLEGSIVDRLKREASELFDPDLRHATLASTEKGRQALRRAYGEYLDIAQKYDLPYLLVTPTWRIDKDVQRRSNLDGNQAIEKVMQYFKDILGEYQDLGLSVYLGGRIGPKNDCYKPELAPKATEAFDFHSFQLEQLAKGGVDFFDACTLPSVAEALGMGKAMSSLDFPYILSFVIRSDAKVLDGVLLSDAIKRIDDETKFPPVAYFLNCVHPKTVSKALSEMQKTSPNELSRIHGFQGNTSLRDPQEYAEIDGIDTCDPNDFAKMTIELGREFNIKALGGCCGTFAEHTEAIAKELKC